MRSMLRFRFRPWRRYLPWCHHTGWFAVEIDAHGAGLERFAVRNIVGVGGERPAYPALRHDTGEHDGQILVDADLERLAWLRVAHETFWKPLAQKFERAFDCAHSPKSRMRGCGPGKLVGPGKPVKGKPRPRHARGF